MMQKRNKAIDEVRAGQTRQIKVDGYQRCTRTMRSKIEPMKKVAQTLRNHGS